MSKRHYRHIVLSPHLDDAPLSCGGSIHKWVQVGESVLVVTLMTGDPPVDPLSPFAEYQHTAWGASAQEAFAIRRAEEAAALGQLDADWHHAGFLDCIYRGDAAGFFYTSNDAIFGTIHPADAPLVDELAGRLAELKLPTEGVTVYAPLGIGNHIDHQLVRLAAEQWLGDDLLFYEDYPYAQRVEAGTLEAQRLGPQFTTRPTLSKLLPLTEGEMKAKTDAIGQYRSQISMLFGDDAQMKASVWAFGRRTADGDGWAERFWYKPPSFA